MNNGFNLRKSCSLWWSVVSAFAPMAALGQVEIGAVNSAQVPASFSWTTVANISDVMPGDVRTFNSFNQPSVNSDGLVAIRGRSKGGQGAGEPLRGVYSRQMGRSPGPLTVVFDNATTVPQPNNTFYGDALGTFTEFPAFPRVGQDSKTIASRAQSKPVWTYTLPDGSETRAGTSGIYVMRQGERISAMTQLGSVSGFSYYAVPGAAAGVKFDQFPGAPAVSGTNGVVFKGNYTDGVQKTGIFFRTFNAGAPYAMTQVIASSDTVIPGQPVGGARFGSTAPPSASATDVVFLGLDNEELPTHGGIYLAPLTTRPALKTLVSIGGQVPDEPAGTAFSRLGEALSYDGRFVAFWGAWGSATRTLVLQCPQDGQSAVIAFCQKKYPDGHTVQVPVNQGFFALDTQTRKIYVVAKTGGDYLDFLYWTFSGRPPGVGDSDSEDFDDPRWRSAAFVSGYGRGATAQVAFKGRKPTMVDGIYLTSVKSPKGIVSAVVETGWDGAMLDPSAVGIPVATVGIEREGLRNGWLAIAASMANAESSWAGVYLTRTTK